MTSALSLGVGVSPKHDVSAEKEGRGYPPRMTSAPILGEGYPGDIIKPTNDTEPVSLLMEIAFLLTF